MELMEDLDPEEARAIVDPALRLMIDAVHRYGGYIVQSTGDGIFRPERFKSCEAPIRNCAQICEASPKDLFQSPLLKKGLKNSTARPKGAKGASA